MSDELPPLIRKDPLKPYVMPFGIHKGLEISYVPASYLLWLSRQPYCPVEVHVYVSEEIAALNEEAKQDKGRWKQKRYRDEY